MKKFKEIILYLLISSNLITNCGCWNYKEVEDSAIVTGMAIDKKEDKYEITVEMLKPSPGFTRSEVQTVVYSDEGDTIFEAVRNLIRRTGRRPYWSHMKVIILSKRIAEEGVQPVIDWFGRDSETRLTTWIFITKSSEAKSIIMQSKRDVLRIVGMELNDTMKNQEVSGRYPKVDLRKFRNSLSADNISATAPLVELEVKDGDTNIVVGGTAVFKGDKLVGELNVKETFPFLMIAEKENKGIIVGRKIGDNNTSVTLEIFKIKKQLNFKNDQKRYSMKGSFKMTVAIDEVSGTGNVIEEKGRKELIQKMENSMKTRLEELVKKVQRQYNADIFGFGRIIEVQTPMLWKEIGESSDGIFEKIDFEAEVKIDIKGSGRQSKTLKIGE